MSRFTPLCCFECGNPIDDKYELFCYLKYILNSYNSPRGTVEVRIIDTKETIYLGEILDKMNIKNLCCRKILLTTVTPEMLETRGTFIL